MLTYLTLILMIVLGLFTIPDETNRVHLGEGLDQWRGDSPQAIYEAAKRTLGKRFADINVQTCADDLMCLHSYTARRNGFHYIKRWHRIGRREMTHDELDRPLNQWKARGVKRWRRTKYRGTTYESQFGPMKFSEMLSIAKAYHVVICPETKSRTFATQSKWASLMRAQVDAAGVTVYPMTLVTMRGWGQKARNFKHEGFEFALLQHNARIPPDLDRWRPYIAAYWGTWGTDNPAPSTI